MSEAERHPRDVVDSLSPGDEFIAQVGDVEIGGRVVDGGDTRRKTATESTRANVEWDAFTLVEQDWRGAGWIVASCDYDGEWQFEVTVMVDSGAETYRVDKFEVVSNE